MTTKPTKKAPPAKLPAGSKAKIHPDLVKLTGPIGELTPYVRNPNIGDVGVIRTSLRRNGQYKPITVNAGTITGRPNEILAGNHTWKAAQAEGWDVIARVFVDVDEREAARICAVDNRAAEKAKRDPDLLAELLGELDDLEGSGYTDADLAKLLGEDTVDDAGEVFASKFELVIECTDEDHQRDLFERLDAEGLVVRVLSM